MLSFPIFSHKNLIIHNTLQQESKHLAVGCRRKALWCYIWTCHILLLICTGKRQLISVPIYFLCSTLDFTNFCWKTLQTCRYITDTSDGYSLVTQRNIIFSRASGKDLFLQTNILTLAVLLRWLYLLRSFQTLFGKWRNISHITTCPTARKEYAINEAAAGWSWCAPLAISITSRKVAGTGWKLPRKQFNWWYYCWRQRDEPSADCQPPSVGQAQEPAEALGRGTARSATAVNGKHHCDTWCL